MQLHNDKFIKDWEQLRLKAYMPTKNDRPTIGWGHTRGVEMRDVISRGMAEEYFREDIAGAESAVNRLVKVRLTQNQFDALVSFVHNLGETNFASSTLLRRLNESKYDETAAQFGRWIYQKKVVLKGLVRRRASEADLFLSSGDPRPPPSTPTERVDETSAKPATEVLKSLHTSVETVAGSVTAIGAAIGLANEQLSVLPEVVKLMLLVGLLGAGAVMVYNRLKARNEGVR